MSGHSKWSTIKRKKAANDARRGNLFTRFAREIAIAAREGGGDSESNFALRLAVDRARASNMPKENIDRAIRRGTGEDKDGAAFEQILYEGYAPHGIALMIEVVTDNRKRTVAEVRHILTRAGGSMAEAGAVAYKFKRKAFFTIPAQGLDTEEVFNLAVEAGAEDVLIGEEDIEITSSVESFKQVNQVLQEADIQPSEAGMRMIPSMPITLDPEQTLHVMRVIENLEEMDDAQQVYSDLDVTEEAVSLLETA